MKNKYCKFFYSPGWIDGVVGGAADKEVKETPLVRSVQRTDYHSVNPEIDQI